MKFKRFFRVTDGKTVKAWRLEVRDYLNSLPNGNYFITIEEAKDNRSILQNRLYWKWLEIIGDDLGYMPKELHEEFLELYAPVFTVRGLDGKPKQKPIRTSKMSVEQMAKYMEAISAFCSQHNIRLPL